MAKNLAGRPLSRRESQVWELLISGLVNASEIGEALQISVGTVDNLTNRLWKKMNLRGRNQLIWYAGRLSTRFRTPKPPPKPAPAPPPPAPPAPKPAATVTGQRSVRGQW
jgi:DNA-binding CsgD family transcriptional regulator